MFIALHHNVTSTLIDSEYGVPYETIRYTYGWKDACAVFFYFLICIVMHAIIQEYILDVSNIVALCLTLYVVEIRHAGGSILIMECVEHVMFHRCYNEWTHFSVGTFLFILQG